MLAADKNDKLMRVGPGTLMGTWMRRFWLPALLEEEISEPDGPPAKVRLLGEDFIAFRDTDGRVGLVEAYCAHRLAPLFLGRNEECGIRCVYHGWKFDVDGRCVDMPNEPADSRYKEKISIRALPTIVAGGVVWAYLGPAELKPLRPSALEWTLLPAGHVVVSKRLQENNWAQSVEGAIDSSHVSFLHREWDNVMDPDGTPRRVPKRIAAQVLDDEDQLDFVRRMAADGAPSFRVRPSDFGFWIGARRSTTEPGEFYWRITPFLVPFYTIIPPGTTRLSAATTMDGHAFVPIDDVNTWTYNISWRVDRPFTAKELAHMRGELGTHSLTDADYRPYQNPRNLWGLDRQLQRSTSFTGIVNANTQDRAIQEGMGPMVDRSREHLGTADTAIIAFRRLLLRGAEDLARGKEPETPQQARAFAVRSASVLLPEEDAFDVAAGTALQAFVRPE
jgi:phthalate 4,5-dioxygenase